MSATFGRTSLLLAALLVAVGCSTPPKSGKSPLQPSVMPPNSVVLDVFFVRFPLGNPQANGELWREVDEQHFPPELRQRLVQNGFRVGVVGSPMPTALSALLELGDKPAPTAGANQVPVGEMEDEPRVTRRHMQVRAGRPADIVASDVYDRLAVLLRESGELVGQTYSAAQAHLGLTALPESDGRVRLDLIPELHYGQAQVRPQAFVGNEAMFRLASCQPRRSFDNLALAATLSPGSMLLIGCLPDRPGSLGQHFFTCQGEPKQQKLLVIRVSQTQYDEAFLPADVLPLQE